MFVITSVVRLAKKKSNEQKNKIDRHFAEIGAGMNITKKKQTDVCEEVFEYQVVTRR